MDRGQRGVHSRSCIDGNGLALHERMGEGSWGTQANIAPGSGRFGLWPGHPSDRRQRTERSAPSDYWGAAASLVTASRMVGMALGLAALSAWGIERFYSLTADVSLGSNFAETEAILIEAGVTVFQNLFMISGFLSLIAIVPALLMKVEDAKEPNGNA